MNRRKLLKSIPLCLLGAVAASGTSTASYQRPLTLGVFPRRNIKTTYRLFSPLADRLGAELGRKVRLDTARDFDSFWFGVRNGRYDIMHYNQYHYIVANKLFGHRVIAMNEEFGHSTLSGAITVRRDSGYETIQDLKGKKILFGGGPAAMQSCIAARWLLQNGGLQREDYIERFALNPPNAIISTYHGQADAAGSGDVVIRMDIVKQAIDVSQMKYLARTDPIAHLPWAVRGDMGTGLMEKIRSTLVNLENDLPGQTALDAAKLSGLNPAADSDYDAHRSIIRDVYGDDLGISRLS